MVVLEMCSKRGGVSSTTAADRADLCPTAGGIHKGGVVQFLEKVRLQGGLFKYGYG